VSARANIIASEKTPCDGGESPNAYQPWITTEIRCHFPPSTVSRQEVLSALRTAYEQAVGQAMEREFYR
jgi:hypothetical protein